MKKFIIGFLTMGVLSAQASMLEVNGPLDAMLFTAQVNDEKTYFETLGDLYKAGKRPNLSTLSNIAWAGRCFFKTAPNVPTNAGYIFRQKENDAGPIASVNPEYEAFSYWKLEKAPNYFDNMNMEQVFTAHPNITVRDAKIKADSIEINLKPTGKSNLKTSGNYLVEELSWPEGDNGPVGKEIVDSRCYYFIPDLNN
jgi:hypothetical protein